MATAKDLNRKHTSGISYARAAKKFGVDIETVREYARQVKEFNRQTKAAAKAYGYKGEYWTAASLSQLARNASASRRFGGAEQLFKYASENVQAKLADSVAGQWAVKAEQYVANVKKALTDSPEAGFSESDVSKAIRKLDSMTTREAMQATGGIFLQYWYHSDEEEDPILSHNQLVDMILGYRRRF